MCGFSTGNGVELFKWHVGNDFKNQGSVGGVRFTPDRGELLFFGDFDRATSHAFVVFDLVARTFQDCAVPTRVIDGVFSATEPGPNLVTRSSDGTVGSWDCKEKSSRPPWITRPARSRTSRCHLTGRSWRRRLAKPLGPLAPWPLGPLALWPFGPLALWPFGPLALWPLGPLALPRHPCRPSRVRLDAPRVLRSGRNLAPILPSYPVSEGWPAAAR